MFMLVLNNCAVIFMTAGNINLVHAVKKQTLITFSAKTDK